MNTTTATLQERADPANSGLARLGVQQRGGGFRDVVEGFGNRTAGPLDRGLHLFGKQRDGYVQCMALLCDRPGTQRGFNGAFKPDRKPAKDP